MQDFTLDLKNDLGEGLASVTKGAKNASEAFRDLALSLANNITQEGAQIGINYLIGAAADGVGLSLPKNSKGGYIGFAKGGFVNKGSGTKDDVPAFLTGGEFVINKNAVKAIGASNLDVLNNTGNFSPNANPFTKFPGVTTDSLSVSGNSANITLADAFVLNSAGTAGKNVSSPLLSAIGQINSLNPQNKLRDSRERYAYSRNIAYQNYQQQLDAYNTQQYLKIGQSALGAAGSIYNGFNQLDGFFGSGTGNAANNSTPPSDAGTNGVARGGPVFAKGGFFGGDSASDKFKAMVMGGEYVVSPQTVKKYGASYFKSLNDVRPYASGGEISSYSPASNSSSDNSSEIISVLQQIRDGITTKQNSSNSNSSNENNSQKTNGISSAPVVNITMQISASNDNSSSNSQNPNNQNNSTSGNQINAEAWKQVSTLVKAQTINIITEQSRPGGILYTNFQKKTS